MRVDGHHGWRRRSAALLLAACLVGCSMLAGYDSLVIVGADSGTDSGFQVTDSDATDVGNDLSDASAPSLDALVVVDAPLMFDAATMHEASSVTLDAPMPIIDDSGVDGGPCANSEAGAVCGVGGGCFGTPTCQAGACVPSPLPVGTACGGTPAACYAQGACTAQGTCVSNPLANGTSCGAAPSTCQRRACESGSCTVVDVVDGTSCGSNPCTTATCKSGSCSTTKRPDGYEYSSGTADRCCNGSATSLGTTSNCGACGIKCSSGASCKSIPGHPACSCGSDSECKGIGYGSGATCYAATSAGLFCNCQCPSGAEPTTCGGQCRNGATCHEVFGQNYCLY